MAKLLIWSDLHVDLNAKRAPFALPDPMPEFDVLVCAGDIGEHADESIEWLLATGIKQPIVYVTGNHDYYNDYIDFALDRARDVAKETNVRLLEDNTVVLAGVRFVGATMWTDYCLMRADQQWAAMQHAEASMNDHHCIRVAAKEYSRFLPFDALQKHITSRDYITMMLEEPFPGKTVVVTHHAPCIRSVPAKYFGDLLNAAYASHLEHLVDRADLWIHGHIHTVQDYRIGDGRVICNPRGYPSTGERTGWDPLLVVDTDAMQLTPETSSA